MAQIGFPGCHKANTTASSPSARDVRKRMERRRRPRCQLIQELPLWFDNHVATMELTRPRAPTSRASITHRPARSELPEEDGEEGAPAAPAGGCHAGRIQPA